jgi:hypothetical protein
VVSRFQRQSVPDVVYGNNGGKRGEDNQIATLPQADFSLRWKGMEPAAQYLGQVIE